MPEKINPRRLTGLFSQISKNGLVAGCILSSWAEIIQPIPYHGQTALLLLIMMRPIANRPAIKIIFSSNPPKILLTAIARGVTCLALLLLLTKRATRPHVTTLCMAPDGIVFESPQQRFNSNAFRKYEWPTVTFLFGRATKHTTVRHTEILSRQKLRFETNRRRHLLASITGSTADNR